MENEQMKMSGIGDTIPTFAPPTPSFTPPADVAPSFSGPACHYHKNEPAVAKCVRCGKYICQDCFDNYGVTDEEYQNEAICYDCCHEMVSENVKELKKQKAKIIALFVATIIGMIFGFMCGMSEGSVGLAIFCMLWFGSFWTWIKYSVVGWWKNPQGLSLAGFVGACLGGLIIAPFKTVTKIVQCIIHLVKTSNFIQSDSEALEQMKDYMEYTLVRNQNKGVDIETLLNQRSELADNTYAQMVREQGETQAEANIRGCVASINENGEIIRSFVA